MDEGDRIVADPEHRAPLVVNLCAPGRRRAVSAWKLHGLDRGTGPLLTSYVCRRGTPEPAEPQFRRLHPIANKSRIVIPTPGQVLNPASRMPGACLHPPSQDIREGHGYRAPLAKTGDAD